MWGNRLGWMISAGIFIITLGIYVMLIFGTGETKPTQLTLAAGAMDPIALPVNPRSLVPAGTEGDATDLYRQAIDAYRANSSVYDQYEKNGKLSDVKKVPAVELIVKAGQASSGKIFSPKPDALVRHNPAQAQALKAIEQVGRATLRVGLLNNTNANKKPEIARKHFEAVFNLGYALYTERLTRLEFLLGLEFMGTAAINLANIDTAKAAEYKTFAADLSAYITGLKYPPIFNIANMNAVRTNSGDVFNLARNGKERMWRVEAILMLGHYRHMAAQGGDQRAATALLEQLAAREASDPVIMAAVKSSQELTLADHRKSSQLQ